MNSRALLALGLGAIAFVLLTIFGRPTMFGGPPIDYYPYDLIAVLGCLIGGVRLVQVYRAHDPEPGPSPWRYRDR